MINQEAIKNTKFYQSLDHIQRVMILKGVSLSAIELGVNMSNLRGFDFWVKNTSPNARIKSIVEELVK